MTQAPVYDDRELDRTPPQDLAAEQSVLGAMMMSKDAISDVVEVLRGVDFYRPNHETIFDAIINLYGRGEPADPITVAGELGKKERGALDGLHLSSPPSKVVDRPEFLLQASAIRAFRSRC